MDPAAGAPLEDWTAPETSVQWRLNDAYFAKRGVDAWKDGEVPFHATSDYPLARQHASLLVRTVEERAARGELGPDEEVRVLEVGAGLGLFAFNLVRALREGCGAGGRRVLERLRYVLTDSSRRTLEQAAASPALSELVRAGTIVPAQLDLRDPGSARTLDDRALDSRWSAILANYVLDATPTAYFRKTASGWQRSLVRLRLADADPADPKRALEDVLARPGRPELGGKLAFEWRWESAELASALPHAVHAAAIERAAADLDEATVAYPLAFLEALRLQASAAPGALLLASDFGSASPDALAGAREPRLKFYRAVGFHPVQFAVIESFARTAGWDAALTTDPSASLHTIALRFASPEGSGLAEAFRATHVERHDAQDFLDFKLAAREALRDGDRAKASRYYRRCLDLDPESPTMLYELARAALELGPTDAAKTLLETGKRFDAFRLHDFDQELGRLWFLRSEFERSVQAFLVSFERRPHPDTAANVGLAQLRAGRPEKAREWFRRALELEPRHRKARGFLASLDA